MKKLKKGKVLTVFLLLAFNLFIFRGTIFASKPPNNIKLKFKMDVKVKWKKQGNNKVPVQMFIGKKAFPMVKKQGKYGVNIKIKELMSLSPAFKNTFQLTVAEIASRKITELVSNDRQKAQEVANHFKAYSRGKATTTAKSSGKCTTQSMHQAYNQVLNSEAFLFPMKPLPFAEEAEEAGEEEEGSSWIEVLAGILFAIVVVFAPIIATVWLATQALTFAAVFTAFFGSVAAVVTAGSVVAFMSMVDHVLQGKPMIDIEGF